MNIREIYEQKPVDKGIEQWVLDVTVNVADPKLIYGVELEIERVPLPDNYLVPGIRYVSDGSLRHNGIEFVSYPMFLNQLEPTLRKFYKKKFTEQNYSERTSIHVHVNVQDLTVDQLASVCLLYQVFEPVFFAFIGNERDKNIFCVPWAETNLTYEVINNMITDKNTTHLHRWLKYSALNLLPIRSQGSIEFRHMHGHSDVDLLITWCNLIGSLTNVARNRSLEEVKNMILDLNTTSQYDVFLMYVFKQWSDHLNKLEIRQFMEEGVTMVKYMLCKDNNKKSIYTAKPILNEQAARRHRLWEEIMDNPPRVDANALADLAVNLQIRDRQLQIRRS